MAGLLPLACALAAGILLFPVEAHAQIPGREAQTQTPSPGPEVARSPVPGLVDILDAELAKRTPEFGAAGAYAVTKLVEAVCDDDEVRGWMAHGCAAATEDDGTIASLRRALLRDLFALSERALAAAPGAAAGSAPGKGIAAGAGAADESVRVAAILLRRIGDSLEPLTIARALRDAGASVRDESLRRAGALMVAALEAGMDPSLSEAERTERLQRALERQLSPGEQEAASKLVATLQQVQQEARRAGEPGEPVDKACALARGMLRAVESAMELGAARGFALPPAVADVMAEAGAGDLSGALDAVLGMLANVAEVPEAAVRGLGAAARLAIARDSEEMGAVVRGLLLGPWSERVLFDINLGAPWLDLDVVGVFGLGLRREVF